MVYVLAVVSWRARCYAIEFRHAKVRANVSDKPIQARFDHPSVHRENASELTFANSFDTQRCRELLSFDEHESDGAAIEPRPFYGVIDRVPNTHCDRFFFQFFDITRFEF